MQRFSTLSELSHQVQSCRDGTLTGPLPAGRYARPRGLAFACETEREPEDEQLRGRTVAAGWGGAPLQGCHQPEPLSSEGQPATSLLDTNVWGAVHMGRLIHLAVICCVQQLGPVWGRLTGIADGPKPERHAAWAQLLVRRLRDRLHGGSVPLQAWGSGPREASPWCCLHPCPDSDGLCCLVHGLHAKGPALSAASCMACMPKGPLCQLHRAWLACQRACSISSMQVRCMASAVRQ